MTNENIINHIHTLLWEYTANYVETSEDSKTKLYTIAVENNFSRYNSNCGDTIEQLEITDCDDFDITDYKVIGDRIIVSFEMIFIAIVNNDDNERFYHIEGTAVGTLSVPSGDNFDFERYDFDDMNKPQLFEYFDIIKDIDLHFEDVEYMGE